MARVRNMQGVPAHLETLKKNDKKRRHPSHCKHHEGTGKERICKCVNAPTYMCGCHTSKNCNYYEEEV